MNRAEDPASMELCAAPDDTAGAPPDQPDRDPPRPRGAGGSMRGRTGGLDAAGPRRAAAAVGLRRHVGDRDPRRPWVTGVSMRVRTCDLDAAALRRTAAVVGLRRHVVDRADLEAGGLEGADRGLAARARALHEDVDLLHAVLLGLTRSGL